MLRCEVYSALTNDPTGEKAIMCGAVALACAEAASLPDVRSTSSDAQDAESPSATIARMSTIAWPKR
ncbi:MAG TPA: hypothetical protein VFI95_12040 [Terriglobales bacterium]|nr:hypothetical protein [Terriglobales bacterium]